MVERGFDSRFVEVGVFCRRNIVIWSRCRGLIWVSRFAYDLFIFFGGVFGD